MKKKAIGVYAPSSPAHIWFEEKYLFAKKQLENMDFEIVEGDLVKDRVYQGYRTASAKERAEEMMNLVKNKDIDIMMPVIGGYNSGSLLPYLDFDEIEKSKKKFFGYSDITALQMAILKKTNLKPIYGGSLIPTFGEYEGISLFLKNTLDNLFFKKSYSLEEPEFYSNKLLNAFTDEWKTKKREYTKNEGWKILNEGETEGEVIIANIDTLVSLLVTEYVPSFKDKILILEEMNATIDSEERNLNTLKLSGVFEGVKGLIFGKPEVYNNKNSNLEYIDIIKEVLGERNYPIIYNFDCGHTIPSLIISQDSLLSLKANHKTGIKVEILKNSYID